MRFQTDHDIYHHTRTMTKDQLLSLAGDMFAPVRRSWNKSQIVDEIVETWRTAFPALDTDQEPQESSPTDVACDQAFADAKAMPAALIRHRKVIEKSYDLDWMIQLSDEQAAMGAHLVSRDDEEEATTHLRDGLRMVFRAINDLDADELGMDLADAILTSLDRQAKRQSERVSLACQEVSAALRSDDATEFGDQEVTIAHAKERLAERHEQIAEIVAGAAAAAFESIYDRAWIPPSWSNTKRIRSAAQIIAQQAVLDRKERETKAADMPTGTRVVITGGYKDKAYCFDKLAMWEKFSKLRNKFGDDLVLILSDEPGAPAEAAKWARDNGVKIGAYVRIDWKKRQRAGFERNNQIVALKPQYCLSFPGNGVTENLVNACAKAGTKILRASI